MKTENFYHRALNIRSCLVIFALSCFMVQASAEDLGIRASDQDLFYQEWDRATNEELDALRGGFVLPNGVHINLSLERFIRLNDELVRSSLFQLPEEMVLQVGGIQNLVSESIALPQLSTIIQNTLDSQQIEAMTKIDIEISNLGGAVADNSNHRIFTDFVAPVLVQ